MWCLQPRISASTAAAVSVAAEHGFLTDRESRRWERQQASFHEVVA
jgi:hypothetical protein